MAVSVPIEITAVHKRMEASVASVNKSLEQLDATLLKINENMKSFGGQQNTAKVQKFGATVTRTNQSIAASQTTLTEKIRITTDAFNETIEAIRNIIKFFNFFRKILLPVLAVIGRADNTFSGFFIHIQLAIIKLKVTIIYNIWAIKKAFEDLASSRSLVEFTEKLEFFQKTVSHGFSEVVDASKEVEQAFRNRFDPAIIVRNLALISGGVLALNDGLSLLFRKILGRNTLNLLADGIKLAADNAWRASLLFDRVGRSVEGVIKYAGTFISKQTDMFSVSNRAAVGTRKAFSRVGQTIARSGEHIDKFSNSIRVAGRANTYMAATMRGTLISKVGKDINATGNSMLKYGNETISAAKKTELFHKSLFGTATRLRVTGIGLTLIGAKLKESESAVISFTGSVIELIGAALDPLGLVFTRLLSVFGNYILMAGTSIVGSNLAAMESFTKFEEKTFAFERTLNSYKSHYPEIISGTETWNEQIKSITQSTGFTNEALQASVAEIVSATTAMGLNESQMQHLLDMSVDYAAQVHGPVLDSTIALINGLNGQSQSVIKYGIHLGEAAVNEKLHSKGIKTKLSKMTESEKSLARLAALQSQHNIITGIAADQATTLAGSTKRYEGRVKDLSVQYGIGAAVVENFSISQKILIGIMDSLNPYFVRATGFLGALLGRTLQVIGVFTKFAFTIVLVTSSFKALQAILGSKLFAAGMAKQLPFLNKSLQAMLVTAGAATGRITNLKQAFQVFGQVTVAQTKRIIASMLGLQVTALSLRTVMIAVFAKIGAAFTALTTFLMANPIILIITAIVGAAYLLYKAFQTIEKHTKIFSQAFDGLRDALRPIWEFFSEGPSVIAIFKKAVSTVFGVFVAWIAVLIQGILKLAKYFVSAKKAMSMQKTLDSLTNFNKKLYAVNFNVNKLAADGDKAKRSLAGVFTQSGLDKLPDDIKKIADAVKDVGKTEIQVLRETRNARLAIIKESLAQESISEATALAISEKVRQEFALKELELVRQKQKELQDIALEFNSAQAFAQQEESKLLKLQQINEAKLISIQEFEAAKIQIELESQAAKENAAKLAVENELKLGMLSTKNANATGLVKLSNEKKLLEMQLAQENIGAQRRKVIQDKIAANEKATNALRVQHASSFFGDMSSLMQTKSKTLFEIGRAAAYANAVVMGAQAVQNALAVQPFPLGVTLAAGAAIKAGVQIATISGQKLSTGITSVPSGFNNDTYPALLESNERVLSAPQNSDLTNFIKNNEANNNNDRFDQMIALLSQIVEDKETQGGGDLIINMGNKELFREIRSGLRGGRSIAV